MPTVSIGIPTYNRAGSLPRAIGSALAQDYPDLRVLVCDNASTDGTEDLCRPWAERDRRLAYQRHPENVGAAGNFRAAFERSGGELFAWLSDDDWMEPDHIRTCVDILAAHPGAAAAVGGIRHHTGDASVVERAVPMSHPAAADRVAEFYRTVNLNGMFYGVIRRDVLARAQVQRALGFDWLVSAAVLACGPLATTDQVTLHRSTGGASKDYLSTAQSLLVSPVFARGQTTTYSTIAAHAFAQIAWTCPAYAGLGVLGRHRLAARSAATVLSRFVKPALVWQAKTSPPANAVRRLRRWARPHADDTMTIKVIYDVQVLGLAMRTAGARTGVARVVDHVARGLFADPACDVRFCNAGPWDLHRHCQRYLSEVCGFRDAAMAPTGAVTAAHRMGLWGSVHSRHGSPRWPVRAIAGPVNAALARGYARRRTAQLGRDADVFHSPFDLLPDDPAGAGPARFLTVYDLIPVLHPEWFYTAGGTNFIAPAFRRTMEGLRPTDYVHCISAATRNDLLNHLPRLDPSRVFVSLLAADTGVFHPCDDPERIRSVRQRYGIGTTRTSCRSARWSRGRTWSRSSEPSAGWRASRGMADLRLVLAGGRGWHTGEVDRAMSEGTAGRDRVIVTGFVPDADLAPLYTDARAFVYPSQYEGFGLPPLEAMACGLPVVTSNTSSLPEVVGDAGLMVAPFDLDALAHAMRSLVHDGRLRDDLSARSRARAATFSWRRCVDRIVAQYGRAVADRGG